MSSNKRKKEYGQRKRDKEPDRKKAKPKRLHKGKLKDDLNRWDQTDWEQYSDES